MTGPGRVPPFPPPRGPTGTPAMPPAAVRPGEPPAPVRRTLVRVLAVQVVALVILWLLQARYTP